MRFSLIGLFLSAVTLTACYGAPDAPLQDEEVGTAESAIEGGVLAGQFHRSRAAYLVNTGCTATRIGPLHLITALHCLPAVGSTVRFYDQGPGPDASFTRTVAKVGVRPGTQWSTANDSGDWTDIDNKFSDIAIVKLNEPVDDIPFAKLAFVYPGAGFFGTKVGAGAHEGNVNLASLLMSKSDGTFSANDDGGGFRTEECAMNEGDSGGAFYFADRVLGVTNGCTTVGDIYWRGRFTSVPEHLDWILDVINYEWSGNPVEARARSGNVISSFTGSMLRCQYACETTSNCVAFNRFTSTGTCQLLSSVTSSASSSVFQSAVK